MTRVRFRSDQHQIAHAYRRMARDARFRPAAPSDGWGNITRELHDPEDLEREAFKYADRIVKEEDAGRFLLGSFDATMRLAGVYLLEATRACCGRHRDLALDLVRLALDELERLPPDEDDDE